MILGRVLLLSLLPVLAGTAPLWADENDAPPSLITTACDGYPQVTCSTTNLALCVDALQMASDARDQLTPLLKLGKTWRFPVHIRIITPNDPLAGKIDRESVSVAVDNKGPSINAIFPASNSNLSDLHVFVQRQYVTALLWEKFFPPRQIFDAHTRLDVLPLWLVEGTREWLDDDPEHTRENIVKRSAQGGRAPTLEDVTSWRALSDDPLVALWQRAFCYYLFENLIHKDVQRATFQEWLASASGPNPASAKSLFPTEETWTQALLASPSRSRDIIYTWDETAGELAAAETIAIPSKQESDTRICTLDTVASFPRDPKLIAAVQQKILDLTSLQLRAHPSWQPILELYRFGLKALVDDKTPDRAKKYFVEAQRQRAAEMENHQKLIDYVNWFEVTKDYASSTTDFQSYFSTARRMENAQADPKHPNPVRADLLHVESQL